MKKSYPFYLSTAFSSDRYAGNPACIVLIDEDLAEDTNTLLKLGANLSQPMSVMIYPPRTPSSDPKIAKFRVRFFTDMWDEGGMCGHGTLAAAGVLFGKPGLLAEGVEIFELETQKYGSIRAKRLEEGWFEISLMAAGLEDLPPADVENVQASLNKAFGREVNVRAMRRGKADRSAYMLVELDPSEDLKGSKVDAAAFKTTGYRINVVTTESITGKEAFISRMFAPNALQAGEDHVCGSAHTLLVPYWVGKGKFGRGELARATQVSCRGGDLRVILEEGEDTVRLQGQVTMFSEGQLFV